MRPITFEAKMEALEFYLEGFSTNDIVAKTGISKGAVISIFKDAREGRFPHLELEDRIDELHSLSLRLRKEGLDLTQARLGFTFLKTLRDRDSDYIYSPILIRRVLSYSSLCSTMLLKERRQVSIPPMDSDCWFANISPINCSASPGTGWYAQIQAEPLSLTGQHEVVSRGTGSTSNL